MSEQLLKYKPHISNFELFSKRILTKNLNPGIFCGGCGGRGGGGGGEQVAERGGEGYEHKSCESFHSCTGYIVKTCLS